MAQVKINESIKANKLFESVSPQELQLSISQKDVISFKEGDIIFQTGDAADEIYLLLEGEIKIKYAQPVDGQRIFEKTSGDFFGEKEFMERQARRSSAVSNKPSIVYKLHRDVVKSLVASHRNILNTIQRLDSGQADLSEFKLSKEIYSEELNSILRNPESSLDPFTYPQSKFNDPTVGLKTGEFVDEVKPEFEQVPMDEFPKKFSTTYEDSFNFSNVSVDSLNENPTADNDGNKTDFNFGSIDSAEAGPLARERTSLTSEFEFKAPSESQNVANNNFPSTESDRQTFPTFDTDADSTTESLDDNSKAHEFLSWSFSTPDENSEELPTDSISVNEKTSFIGDGISPLASNELRIGEWTGNDLTADPDQPIKEFEFDEFGNLIASSVAQPVEDSFETPVYEYPSEADQDEIIPKSDNMRENILVSDDESDFDEDKFIFNNAEEIGKAKFGDEEFKFTAPLTADAPHSKQINKSDEPELTSAQLKLIIEAAQITNSNIKIDEVLNTIVQAASLLTEADRGTLYIVDSNAQELWSKVIRGDDIEEIRLKIGQGLAGWVAATGEIVNIKDVRKDKRFEANVDRETGYITKSMLCFPIKNKAGYIVAVIQLLNSKRGLFTKLDETFLSVLSVHIAIALENAELVEQLLKTDRLTSLGKVAKFLISDIKKPIITIKNLAEHIRKKNLSPDINQVIMMMIEQSNIVVDLVLTTLSFSEGKTVLNKKVISLHRVLTELIDLLAEYVDYRKTKLFKKLGPEVLVNIDKREMYQAFFQITKNACDSMPQGGELYITARLSEDESKILISFKDHGVGIPSSILDKVKDPFMSHGKPHGVGLGLPITEKIVKEHDGNITVESQLGEGTTVTIELPVVKEY